MVLWRSSWVWLRVMPVKSSNPNKLENDGYGDKLWNKRLGFFVKWPLHHYRFTHFSCRKWSHDCSSKRCFSTFYSTFTHSCAVCCSVRINHPLLDLWLWRIYGNLSESCFHSLYLVSHSAGTGRRASQAAPRTLKTTSITNVQVFQSENQPVSLRLSKPPNDGRVPRG